MKWSAQGKEIHQMYLDGQIWCVIFAGTRWEGKRLFFPACFPCPDPALTKTGMVLPASFPLLAGL